MNRIYRLAWNRSLGCFVPASEVTRARGKGKTGRSNRSIYGAKRGAAAALAAAAALTMSPLLARAGPTGGQIVSGSGNITQAGTTTTIDQASQNLSLNWASFNIAPQESVNFVQPSAAAIAINRIFDTNGTQILGHLNANGQIFLINPNGVLFGSGSQVDVGGLIATTLDVSGADAGNSKVFSGSGSGSVINAGTITAASGGYVALLGNHVGNQGTISARLGTVALGAGSAVTLTFNGNDLVGMQVDQSVLHSLAENGGLVQADGGRVIMTAGAKSALLASVVNNTGVIEARTVNDEGGVITLQGGMTAGSVEVGGTLDASAPNGGNGGSIETSGAHVQVADGA
jgi:filamentous hemagglutinin family protein